MLGMRVMEGIEIKTFNEQHGGDLLLSKAETIDRWMAEGFLVHKDGRLCPTLKGLAVADRMALVLCGGL